MPLGRVKCDDCPKVLLGNAALAEHVQFFHRTPCVCGHSRASHAVGYVGSCTRTTWRGEREQFCGCPGFQERPVAIEAGCDLCDKGFPVEAGDHYGTQSLGMIPTTRCAKVAGRDA